jgi:hypothetical protein
MQRKFEQLKDLKDVIRYWRACIDDAGEEPTEDDAYNIVNIVSHPLFDEWHDRIADKDFIAIFENAKEIEINNGDKRRIVSLWHEIREHLDVLEKRFDN